MTANVVPAAQEWAGILIGAAVLALFAVLVALRHRPKILPGSSGHREDVGQSHEIIRPDGYIDGFAGEIEEAGGSLPPAVLVALPLILVWWVVYLIVNWAP